MKRCFAVLVCVGVAACADSRTADRGSGDGGTLVIAITQDPATLFPPLVETVSGKQITEQIYDYLADVGPGLNTRSDSGFRPELAQSWTWSRDSLSIAFHLSPRARWHDGASVTAHDVQFTHALNRNPALGGRMQSELANIDSVTSADSLTAVFWFHERGPTQFLDAAAQLLILPAHQLEAIKPEYLREHPPAPIGTGRFRFKKWNLGSSVELVSDSANYRGRAKLDRVIWTIYPEFNAAVTRLLSGDADLFDALRLENVAAVQRRPNLRIMTLSGSDYVFLAFNLRNPADTSRPHPLFASRAVRRAITMAIDREALVRSVFDTLATVPLGPTVRAFPTTTPQISQLPFDPARAQALLDSLGWRVDQRTGLRTHGGRQLSFTVIVPLSSLGRMRMASLIQAQLKRVGVEMQIETMDPSAQSARLASGEFDASLSTWHLGASPDGIRGSWTSSGIGSGGTNYGAYSNPVFDHEVDTALRSTGRDATAAFTKAYSEINQDAPAVWLYEPKTVIGLDRRLRPAVLRQDEWWFDLADWYVPATDRILRDRVPVIR